MTRQDKGRRFLVLGAGVLLIGSLGVGSASATDYRSNGNCVEVSTYEPPRQDGNGDGTTDSSTDSTDTTGTTDNPLDPITDPVTDPATDTPLDPITDPVTDPATDPLTDSTAPVPDPLGGGDDRSPRIPIQDTDGSSPGDGGGSTTPPSTGGAASLLPSGGSSFSSPRGLRAAPGTDSSTDSSTDDSDLDEGPNTLTTTDRGEGYDSAYDSGYDSGYDAGSSSYTRTTCYFNYSVGHYWYTYRPVGQVYATQVKRVPSGGVDTGH